MNLSRLDTATQDVLLALIESFRDQEWDSIRYVSRWAPSGDAGTHTFWRVAGISIVRGSPEDINARTRISDASLDHWKITQALGQPRWYMMTVDVDRSGKYTVDFEYRDHYADGDIFEAIEYVPAKQR